MPIYEYQCESCADRFEIKQSMKDDPLTACPRCGKHVQRLISSPAIMFKGSGWYVTDYSDKMKPSAGSEVPVPVTGEKKDATPSASDQTAPTAPSVPASPPPPPCRRAPHRTRRQTLHTQRRPHRRLPLPNRQRRASACVRPWPVLFS